MSDIDIVGLYWKRDEAAINETERQYGKYLTKIAYNILADFEDSKESVNDTYLKAWNSMPPHKPNILSTFLGKITRQVSIDVFRKRSSQKRRNSEYMQSLSELEECVSGGVDTEQEVEYALLVDTINTFLRSLSPEARNAFMGRYYFMDSIREMATNLNISESKAKSILYRVRLGLKANLEKEGFLL